MKNINKAKRECHAEWLETKNCYRIYKTSRKNPNGDTLAFVNENELDGVREWAKINAYDKLIIDKQM